MRPGLVALLVAPAFALAACGGAKNVNTATYTCGQFNKSLKTKGDNSSGNFINQLRKQAKLDQKTKTERAEIAFGTFVACRNKPAATRPAKQAIAIAKQVKAGKLRGGSGKKSAK